MKALAIVGCCAVAYALVALGAYLALMTAITKHDTTEGNVHVLHHHHR